MRVVALRRAGRRAWTLIELLVVIAIIAILMVLLLGGVQRVRVATYRTGNMNDINQLNTAVVNFMTTYHVSYIPSRIHLSETNQYDLSKKLDADSVAFLKQMFPRADFTPGNANIWYDWNGNGTKDVLSPAASTNGEYILEGDQCLVFFLGGIPIPLSASNTVPGCSGFSAVPSDPTYHTSWQAKLKPSGPGTVNKPLFDFQPERLANLPHFLNKDAAGNKQPNGFYSYFDYYYKLNANDPKAVPEPYLYFSSYAGKTSNNGYNRYFDPKGTGASVINTFGVNLGPTTVSDCPTPGGGVWPYAEAPTSLGFPYMRYVKPDGFQIISAGRDGLFGPGTSPTGGPGGVPLVWTPATADSYGGYGADDQSNFYTTVLGSSP